MVIIVNELSVLCGNYHIEIISKMGYRIVILSL